MSLDHVTGDLGGMTGREVIGDAKPLLHGIDISRLDHARTEPGLLQVLNLARAAAATRVTVNRDLVLCRPRAPYRNNGGAADLSKDAASGQAISTGHSAPPGLDSNDVNVRCCGRPASPTARKNVT